jgi:hypothetical protein
MLDAPIEAQLWSAMCRQDDRYALCEKGAG